MRKREIGLGGFKDIQSDKFVQILLVISTTRELITVMRIRILQTEQHCSMYSM